MILKPRQREQVLPLPVALISTVSQEGIRNIAPWSNITPILRPFDEIVMASWIKRDTLNNIRQTKEFVINVPHEEMVEQVILCSKNYPPEVDEFEVANLAARSSQIIKPPGIEGCLAWMECTLVEEISRKNYSLVIGKVVHLEVDDRFFNENGDMDFEQAKPLSIILGDKGMWFTSSFYAGRYADYAEMFLGKKDETPVLT
jgi:flavin reductase (DIM6/NTAB) family NADH-FMN oxidoreductase RutF